MAVGERLQLIVDATTSQAEAKFARLSGDADKAEGKARTAGQAVATAADRVAIARLKEANAAGQVTVAETRLTELRASGRASASQLAAAEERLQVALRNQHVASTQLQRAQAELTTSQRVAATELEHTGRGGRSAGEGLKAAAVGAAAFLGLGLTTELAELPQQFVEGARSAGQLARSMNATTEEAGAFLGLVGTLGLDLNDLLEIQAEFAQKVAAQADDFEALGAQVQNNADGTVNWSNTLVDFLGQLQGVTDATERNRLGFAFLGEEGFKQLSRLVNSGVDVRDALAQIGVPFTDEDIALAAEYDARMRDFTLSTGQLERSFGRALLPVLIAGADVLEDVLEVVTAIPGPMAAATVAAVVLGRGGIGPLTINTAAMSAAMGRAAASMAAFRFIAGTTGITAAAAAVGVSTLGVAGGAASRAVAFLGGPLGVALIAASAAYYAISEGADAFRESAHEAAVEMAKADEGARDSRKTSQELGRQLADEAGFWEGVAASRRGAANAIDEQGGAIEAGNTATGGMLTTVLSLVDQFTGGEIAAQGFTDEIDAQAEALGAAAVQSEAATAAVKDLNDLVAEGTVGGRDFADAVKVAADSQAEEARTSGLAEAAIDAYNATTRDAVQTTLDLYNAQLGQRGGLIDLQRAIYDVTQTTDDAKTPWNEVTEATNKAIESAISYAGTTADAAVAAAEANGQIVDDMAEAQIRAQATIEGLRTALDQPGLTDSARQQITDLIGQLEEAKDSGDIEAVLRLTGADETSGEIDQATEDRETTVTVESRGGPAVDAYLDRVANATRMAVVRVESRGGPAVREYLRALAEAQRLAIIRVESRGGPAVDAYLDGLADQHRLAIINVETRGGPDVAAYLDSLASDRTAIIRAEGSGAPGPTGFGAPLLRGGPAGAVAGGTQVMLGSVTLDLELTGRASREQFSKAERGRATVENIRAYEQRNGTGWRRNP